MPQLENNVLLINNYGLVARFLHWSIALFIIANYALGLTLKFSSWYTLHKQIGLTILFLSLLRILWRICTPYPALLDELSQFEKVAAKFGHLILYCLILIIPISGILMVQHHGYPLYFWGMISIPTIPFKLTLVQDNISLIHLYLANFIIFLALFHALFALKHHFFNKDRTLLRMISSK